MTSPSLWRRMRTEDDGQLLLLVLAYTVIAALLVTVVVNLSTAYLYRRALAAAADAAALDAANQPDLERVYLPTTTRRDLLPVDAAAAIRAVDDYAAIARLDQRFNGFQVVAVSVDADTVTVTLGATVRMPFANLVSKEYDDGYHLQVTATARSPVRP